MQPYHPLVASEDDGEALQYAWVSHMPWRAHTHTATATARPSPPPPPLWELARIAARWRSWPNGGQVGQTCIGTYAIRTGPFPLRPGALALAILTSSASAVVFSEAVSPPQVHGGAPTAHVLYQLLPYQLLPRTFSPASAQLPAPSRHARTHAHTHARKHAHARTCTHTHTHTNTHTHTHAHTHVQNLFTGGVKPTNANFTYFLALVDKSTRADDFYVDGSTSGFTGAILAPDDAVRGRGCGASAQARTHPPPAWQHCWTELLPASTARWSYCLPALQDGASAALVLFARAAIGQQWWRPSPTPGCFQEP